MNFIKKLLEGYGSFFGLNQPLSKALILICALLQPASGIMGLIGGMGVIAAHKLLQFETEHERIEIVNGILAGMLIGSLYMPGPVTAVLTLSAGALVALVGALLSELNRQSRLPLLGLPYALVSYVLLPVAAWLSLPLAPAALMFSLPLPPVVTSVLNPLGAIYFNGTALGGLLVLLGFFISSRHLALTALFASAVNYAFLKFIGISEHSTLFLVAQMNGVLTAAVIGSLYAVPGKRSLTVAMVASLITSILALCFSRLLWIFSLPPLALPFVVVTYACLTILTAQRGTKWACFWLPVPALPETSLERITLAKLRGVEAGSIALRAPFSGRWTVYQGFDGAHTHQKQWRYALDFFQIQDGISFSSSGAQLQDFFSFGKPVVSPAYGTVVAARGDLPDNRPGDVDTENNWGNFVMIRLDGGAHVLLAHLQRNSLRVQVNHRVHPGMMIASVGNSGRSPQPHLHMHVQESAVQGTKTVPFHLTGVVCSHAGDNQYSLSVVPSEQDEVSVPMNNVALKRAIRLTVGSQLSFEVVENGIRVNRTLHVRLDIFGQFWLESDGGGRVAFTLTDDFLAFYNRSPQADDFLDAFVLSFGLTPMAEGPLKWTDAVPKRVLPMSRLSRAVSEVLYAFAPCASSSFERVWDAGARVWKQTAQHSLGPWKVATEANLCEANGLVGFAVTSGGRKIIEATLVCLGLHEDNGIPATSLDVPAARLSSPVKVTAA